MKNLKSIFIILFSLLLTQCFLFKKTEGFKAAQKFLEANAIVSEKLGKITDYGSPMGNYKLDGGFGTAKFDFSITGEKGKANVKIALEKNSMDWDVTSAFLTPENGEEIDLLLSGRPFAFFNSFYSDEKWGAPIAKTQFKSGQTLYFHAQAHGMKVDEKNMVYAQLDAELTFPNGQKEFQAEVVKGPSESPKGDLDLYYSLPISDALPADPKPYALKLTLWDLQTQQKIDVTGEFTVIAGTDNTQN